MTPERWRELLSTWSREILAVDRYREAFSLDVVAAEWLGYPVATQEEIAQAEARLGSALPPSYRTFLTVTNGWRRTTHLVARVQPVSEIGWYRDVAPEALAGWLEGEHWSVQQYGRADDAPLTGEGLEVALAISDYEDGIYMLLPRPTSPDGAWSA
jgi:cell wall assembly regulator SMI1